MGRNLCLKRNGKRKPENAKTKRTKRWELSSQSVTQHFSFAEVTFSLVLPDLTETFYILFHCPTRSIRCIHPVKNHVLRLRFIKANNECFLSALILTQVVEPRQVWFHFPKYLDIKFCFSGKQQHLFAHRRKVIMNQPMAMCFIKTCQWCVNRQWTRPFG